MKLTEYLSKHGAGADLARRLGVTAKTVSAWRHGQNPHDRAAIEAITGPLEWPACERAEVLAQLRAQGASAALVASACGVSRQAARYWLTGADLPHLRHLPTLRAMLTPGPRCEVCGSTASAHRAGSRECLTVALAVRTAERDQARADVAMLRAAAGLSVTVYGTLDATSAAAYDAGREVSE